MEPTIIIRPEALSPEIKAQAAAAGVSVRVHPDVPTGQVFVYDPEGQLRGRREVMEVTDQVMAQDHHPVLRSWGPRLLHRRRH